MLGIEGHVWYSFLDRKIAQPTWRNVLKKLLLDQTVAAPVYTLTYIVGTQNEFSYFLKIIFSYFEGTSALEGRTSYHQLINDIQTNLIPLYLMDCLIFSPVQIFNFKYIPSSYRVPFLTLCAFGFDVFMSAYKHKYEGIHVHNNQK
jgi:protein Mpv17